jgi:protease II
VDPRPKSRDRSWSKEEVAAIVEAALNAGKTWIADVIILAYELGLRIHIRQHRKPRPIPLTFHGFRYTDAQEHYRECLAAGKTKEEAEKETAKRLGHRRPQVTRGYVGPF